MRNYKKVSECPEELDKIIEFVNLLPKNIDEIFVELKNLMESFANERNEIWDSEENGEKYKAKVLELLGDEHFSIVAYIYEQVHFWDAKKAYYNLESLVYAKQIFAAIAKAKKDADNYIDFRKDWLETSEDAILHIDRIRRQGINSQLNPFGFRGNLQLDLDWNIKPKLPDVVKIFGEIDISVERIRECPICKKVFWAKKLNSMTCGEKKCIDDFQNLKKKEAREVAKKAKERK